MYDKLPLPTEYFLKLRDELDIYQYKIVENKNIRLLAVKTPDKYPDLVNDLERTVERVNVDDCKNLTHVCLIGEKEVLGIQPKLLEVLLRDRIKYDEATVSEIRDKLRYNEGIVFVKKDDIHKVSRYAYRVNNAKGFRGYISLLGDIPKDVDIVYLIGDNDYRRFMRDDLIIRAGRKDEINNFLIEQFHKKGYQILAIDDFDLAVTKDSRRIVFKYYDNCDVNTAKDFLENVERVHADVGFIISEDFAPDVKTFSYGKKIELLKVDEVKDLCL